MSNASFKKAIGSLAFIKLNWDKHRKDYMDSFVPFFSTLLAKNNYQHISTKPEQLSEIRDDFKEEFGLSISYYALVTIIRRAEGLKLIEKVGHAYIPTKKIYEHNCEDRIKEFGAKYESLLKLFIDYSENNYNMSFSLTEAERILAGFLSRYDLDILFASLGKSPFPSVDREGENIVLFGKYIEYIHKHDADAFKKLIDVAVGHSLSHIISYEEPFGAKSSLKDVNLYLDTRFIIRLLGAEGESFESFYTQLVLDFNKVGINLYVFPHTQEEIDGIFQNCISLIDSPHYDPLKASRVLRHFKEKGYKESDVQLFIYNIENAFQTYNIKIVDVPDPNVDKEYQIDVDELYNEIIKTYDYTPEQVKDKDYTIYKDVKSISYIYKLRGGRKPRKIKKGDHIFITTNSKLAFASKKFEETIYGMGQYIPVTTTDIFIGTLIWLKSHRKMIEESKKRILANVYAILEPSDELLKQYINEVERLRKRGDVSQDDYILLRDSQVAKKLLTKETLGNIDTFSPKTPLDILDEIREEARDELIKERAEREKERKIHEEEKIKIKEEETIRFQREREEHEKTREKLDKIDQKVGRIASIFSIALCIGFVLIFLWVNIFYGGTVRIIGTVLSIIGLGFGFMGLTMDKIRMIIKRLVKIIIGLS